MTQSLAENAIALLIELAERGEIDPWDVKVIEVIDRFLSKLQPTELEASERSSGRSPYEADLSESGQAFLYASMLLLLKADSLARLERQQDETPLDEAELIAEAFADRPLPPNLEKAIRRRAVAPPAPNRRVTLPELIAQLNLMATAMLEPKDPRIRARRPRPQSRSQAIKAIAELAHQENLSEVAAALEQFLLHHWQEIGQDWLDFELLLEMWIEAQPPEATPHPHRDGASPTCRLTIAPTAPSDPPDPPDPSDSTGASVHDRVGVFWALLFLSAQSKVELAQETFYQDLQVRSLAALPTVGNLDQTSFVLPD